MMIIETQNNFIFEVAFSILDREPGFDDDVRVAMRETGPKAMRILRSDQCSVLLTADQAERLGQALLEAAKQSRST